MKYLIPLFIILLIPFVIAISDDAGNRIDFKYDSPTFDNNTAYVNNSAGWLEMDAFNATQMDDGADSQTLNIKESWVRGLVNAATKWIIDVPGGYLYNDSTTIYFNGTELNKTIDQRVTGAGDNSSWNESYADTLYSNITWNYNQTLGAEVYTNSTNSTLASWIEELFIKISDVVSYVGNWSADKDSYYNTTQIDNGTYTSTYNATYDNYKTNVSLNWSLLTAEMWNESWISTYNATYDSFVDTNETDRVDSLNSTIINSNASWLTTQNDTYDTCVNNASYLLISNETTEVNSLNETIIDSNESWISTYNATYDAFVDTNETDRVDALNSTIIDSNASWISTYNTTYDAKVSDNVTWNETGAREIFITEETDPTFSSNLTNGFSTHLFPEPTLTYDLGSGANRWRWLYVQNISADYGDFIYDVNIGGDLQVENINATNITMKNIWIVNMISSGNNTADWFNGQFNWTTGTSDGWITNSFDGSTLDATFNSSKLSTTYYNATQSTAIAGTINGGTLVQTQHPDGNYDGITFNFTEVTGAPGLDLRVNFTGITEFNGGVMRYKSSTLSGLAPIIQLWNYNDLAWEDYPPLSISIPFRTIQQDVFDWTDHIGTGTDLGIVQMRLYKASNGNTQNKYYVDWIAIRKGFGTLSTTVDLSQYFRANNPEDTKNYTTSGYVNATILNYFNISTLLNGTFTGDDNESWNESMAFNLFLNRTSESDYLSTYNATYDTCVNNASYLLISNETDRVDSLNSTIINSNASWLTTYNETYDGYNSTGLILDYNESGFIYDYNETGLLIDYNGSGFIYDYNESNLIINHTIETFNLWDTRWISTQNDTYDTCVNNASYLLISNETERVNSLNLTKYEENDNASFYNVTAENTIVGNNFISTIGAGDVLFVDPFNNNTNIWRASTGSSDYGFYMQYYGAGSGNANSLRLYTEGQLGTDVWVWDITQDGKADFKQDFESSGSITATTNVYSGYAGTFGSVASDVHIDAGGGGTIFLDATNTYGGDANFDSYAEHSVALEIPQERTALSYFTTTAEDRTYLKDGVLTYNHTNKDDELLYSIKELETCENTTLIDNRTGDKEEDYIKEGCVTEQIETKSISNLVELLRDAIFELKTENDKIKDCAKNSPDYSKYQTCIAGVEMVGL